MIAFYTTRKLIESHFTRPEPLESNFTFKSFPSLGKRVSYFVWPEVQEKYDLKRGSVESRDARFIANQFIHSFVFRPTRAKKAGLSGVFVASDREKDRQVFWFAVDVIVAVLEGVAASRSGLRIGPEKNEMFCP